METIVSNTLVRLQNTIMSNYDRDINCMDRKELKQGFQLLRDAVRKHRDAKGHDLCWLNNTELYQLLPEQPKVDPQIPPWPEFMDGCVRYRQMLDTKND